MGWERNLEIVIQDDEDEPELIFKKRKKKRCGESGRETERPDREKKMKIVAK